MNTIDILSSAELRQIINNYRDVSRQKVQNAWNLFNLSSYNNQLENFHSDVIASLLNPSGVHSHGDRLLNRFVQLLNTQHGLRIEWGNYGNALVLRESGRLDVWIKNRADKRCIIIENKMNNADDMENQLTRYHKRATQDGYLVDAIVYLSIDGIKKAPMMDDVISRVVRNVAAFDGTDGDLVNGWLHPGKQAVDEESATLIHQYTKLIKHQSNRVMEQDVRQQFYQLVSDDENRKGIVDALRLYNELNTYRRDEFSRKMVNWKPFERKIELSSYGNCATLFQFYKSKGSFFKLDVFFDYHEAWVRLWLPEEDNAGGLEKVQSKLSEIGLLQDFVREKSTRNSSMMVMKVRASDGYNMAQIDGKIYDYVTDLMKRLAALPK